MSLTLRRTAGKILNLPGKSVSNYFQTRLIFQIAAQVAALDLAAAILMTRLCANVSGMEAPSVCRCVKPVVLQNASNLTIFKDVGELLAKERGFAHAAIRLI